MKYLKVWTSFRDLVKSLHDDEVGRLFLMMLEYAETGEEPTEYIGNEMFLFPVAKQMIDLASERNEKLRENGKKGGRPKNQEEPNETKDNQTKPTETKDNQTKAVKERKEKECKEKESKRFIPPTVEEVAEYCRERNNGINAQHFVDYQIARNWVLSNGKKMSDWKATIRTWEGNGYHNKPAGRTVTAQQYGQRDYSGEQDEAMKRMMQMVQEGA